MKAETDRAKQKAEAGSAKPKGDSKSRFFSFPTKKSPAVPASAPPVATTTSATSTTSSSPSSSASPNESASASTSAPAQPPPLQDVSAVIENVVLIGAAAPADMLRWAAVRVRILFLTILDYSTIFSCCSCIDEYHVNLPVLLFCISKIIVLVEFLFLVIRKTIPLHYSHTNATSLQSVVAGRLINCYNPEDYTLNIVSSPDLLSSPLLTFHATYPTISFLCFNHQ